MKSYTKEEIAEVLRKHGLWWRGESGGERADLQGADLPGADLRGAYLRYADLRGAYLRGAHLQGAHHQGAKGVDPSLLCDLLMLLEAPGPLRAFKLVKANGTGPFNGGLKYEVGGQYEVADANTDPNEACGAGIHVATLPWVMREWQDGYRVLLVEFWAKDIACIPTATDGKFRLHRCRVVEERDVSALVKKMRGEA